MLLKTPICGVPLVFVAATYTKYDSILKTSGALHLAHF